MTTLVAIRAIREMIPLRRLEITKYRKMRKFKLMNQDKGEQYFDLKPKQFFEENNFKMNQ